MESHRDQAIPGYQWLARNPDKFGDKPIVRGTRFTVAFILGCLTEGLGFDEIVHDCSEFPRLSVSEVLRFAADPVGGIP